MSAEKSEALVLRITDFSETSRVVVLLTREFGKISVLAKGGRRLKGPFESALDLLSTCRIVFLRKSTSGLDILTEAQLVSRFRPGGRDLSGLYGGYYVAELLLGLTEEYDPHLLLYDAAQETLGRLSEAEQTPLAIARFELLILREIGQLPAFDCCIACGTAIGENMTFEFRVSQGGLVCEGCRREDAGGRPRVHAGTVALLRRLSSASETVSRRLAVSAAQLREIRAISTPAISHALGRRPKTLRYLSF